MAHCNLIRQEIAKQFAKESANQIAKSQPPLVIRVGFLLVVAGMLLGVGIRIVMPKKPETK
jgi:hypothetical protein